jgi:ligand-binding sensor protein
MSYSDSIKITKESLKSLGGLTFTETDGESIWSCNGDFLDYSDAINIVKHHAGLVVTEFNLTASLNELQEKTHFSWQETCGYISGDTACFRGLCFDHFNALLDLLRSK